MIDAILGYPKCGNTWIYVLLHKAREFDPNVIKTGGRRFTHAMPKFNEESYKTMEIDFSLYKNASIVMLIRDPKDVLVSLYMHNRYRENKPLYTGSIDDMVRDEVYGIRKYVEYYEQFSRAMEMVTFKRVMILPYEALIQDTYKWFKSLLDYGAYNLSPKQIEECIEFASFDNMKRLEKTNGLGVGSLSTSPNADNSEAWKVRRGKIGGYTDYLKPMTITYIDAVVDRCMSVQGKVEK